MASVAVQAEPGKDFRRLARRTAPAVALAAVLHLLLFLAVGLIVPKADYRFAPQPAPVRLILLPPMPSLHHRDRPLGPIAKAVRAGGQAAPTVLPNVHRPPPAPRDAPPSPLSFAAGEDKPATPSAEAMQFYERSLSGCGREDLILLTPEERARCTARAVEAARGGRPPTVPDLNGLDPAKRAAWDAEVAAARDRRDGSGAQAELRALQGARGALAPRDHGVDVNVGFHCRFKFGGDKGLDCRAGPPAPNPPH